MNKSRVEPTIFYMEKNSFSLKLFSGHFYGQSFIKTVRGPLKMVWVRFILTTWIKLSQMQHSQLSNGQMKVRHLLHKELIT